MKAICVIGLGFGDEGKGATVDYLCRKHKPSVVVRYQGGCQASHAIHSPEGVQHCCHQVGSGVFCDVPTYLARGMIVDPILLRQEMGTLSGLLYKMPEVFVHPRCLVTTLFHKIVNQFREEARFSKHGTCGQGVGETQSYFLRYGHDAIFIEDCEQSTVLLDKMHLMHARLKEEAYELSDVAFERFRNMEVRNLSFMLHDTVTGFLSRRCVRDEPPINLRGSGMIIMEGAQGILLDEHKGFRPYVTWSPTTTLPAVQQLQDWGFVLDTDITIMGVTRAYATRHGAGPLPTHIPQLSSFLKDPNNQENKFQGDFRFGWLDFPLLKYAVKTGHKFDCVALNHMDQAATITRMHVCNTYAHRLADSRVTEFVPTSKNPLDNLVNYKAEFSLVSTDDLPKLVAEAVGAPVTVIGRGVQAAHREEVRS